MPKENGCVEIIFSQLGNQLSRMVAPFIVGLCRDEDVAKLCISNLDIRTVLFYVCVVLPILNVSENFSFFLGRVLFQETQQVISSILVNRRPTIQRTCKVPPKKEKN